ncbi:hypothetical protein TrispH2_011162 [Trichoplax sp. H2]|nr:hypothetical protein TrispH2_011162 [Trichoplax sp. H2]|eukprot:RDD36910.1 hypothetical protein TrispH2_011162 [Trichoplax sp. H2]
MELSDIIKANLDKYAEEFIKIVPIKELFTKLKVKKILSSRDIIDIEKLTHVEDMNGRLLEILQEQRSNEDFYTFCSLLKQHHVNVVKAFGAKLQLDTEENPKTLPDVDIYGNNIGFPELNARVLIPSGSNADI